ncbi:MAG: hypothetical protein QOJ82_731 [Solirubrobacteraceae bacterium]|nr:hypothetical protein [Solirubrobacteraceae bacterium]
MGVISQMTIRAPRVARLLLVAVLASFGLALSAQAAFATYSQVTIVKINKGGPATDTFKFHPSFMPAAADFSLKGGQTSSTYKIECNVDRPGYSCSRWGYPAETISEVPTPGYKLTDVKCYSSQGNGSYTNPYGTEPTQDPAKIDADTTWSGNTINVKAKWYEWVKCWVTNTRDQGQIKVTKKIVSPLANENGHFNLKAYGPDTVTANNVGNGGTTGATSVASGTYTVSETAATGTSLSDYDSSIYCDDTAAGHTGMYSGTGTSLAGVKVDAGDYWDCTITNKRKVAYLEVQKDLVPASDAGRFDLHGDGPSSISASNVGDGGSTSSKAVVPGTYQISEAAAAGSPTTLADYRSSIHCELKNSTSSSDANGASLSGLVIKAGETWQCTVTNERKQPKIMVVKDGPATAYSGDKLTFSFTVTNPGNEPLTDVTVSDDKCSPVTKADNLTDTTLDPGDTWKYTCSYVATHNLGDTNPVVNTVTATGKDHGGQPVNDTDTHSTRFLHPAIGIKKSGPATAEAGSLITYSLDVSNPGDQSFAAPLVVVTDALCQAPPALQGKNGDTTPNTLDPGDHWTYTCQVQTQLGQTSVVNGAQDQGTDQNGKVVTAQDTFTTTLTQPAPVTATSSPAPGIGVSPERAVPGTARLRGPTGCPTTKASASVSGSKIVKVTFFVDNKKVKTLTKPNQSGGRWTLPLNVAKYSFGSHRVQARIEFAKSSGTGTKTLRLSFNRCRSSLVKPKFTG